MMTYLDSQDYGDHGASMPSMQLFKNKKSDHDLNRSKESSKERMQTHSL